MVQMKSMSIYFHIISLQLKSVGESLLGGDKFAPKQTTLLDMVRSVSKVVPWYLQTSYVEC